jgi:hypothetical protein
MKWDNKVRVHDYCNRDDLTGLRIRSITDAAKIGIIYNKEWRQNDEPFWCIKWNDGTSTEFWWNKCDCEVVGGELDEAEAIFPAALQMGYRAPDPSIPIYLKPFGYTVFSINEEACTIALLFRDRKGRMATWSEEQLPSVNILHAIKEFESDPERCRHLTCNKDTAFHFLTKEEQVSAILEEKGNVPPEFAQAYEDNFADLT